MLATQKAAEIRAAIRSIGIPARVRALQHPSIVAIEVLSGDHASYWAVERVAELHRDDAIPLLVTGPAAHRAEVA